MVTNAGLGAELYGMVIVEGRDSVKGIVWLKCVVTNAGLMDGMW